MKRIKSPRSRQYRNTAAFVRIWLAAMDKSLEQPSRIVDPEVLGHEPGPSFLRRLAARLGVSLILGAVGLLVVFVGGVLTLSIIGAAVGVPLLIIGLLLVISALLLPFAR